MKKYNVKSFKSPKERREFIIKVNNEPIRYVGSSSVKFLDWSRALRIHQWLKNLLLFIPYLAAHHLGSHQLGHIQSLTTLALAFISFSLCASSVYVINDLLDLESDRRHPRKKYRPFASAKLSILVGVGVIPFLIGIR